MLVLVTLFTISCKDNGNTGNGSMDTGVKVGSGYSDSLDPERGTLDTSTTPNDNKKERDEHH